MPTLTIHGRSDDLIEADGIAGADEFNIVSDNDRIATLRVYAYEGDELLVHCLYINACWSFAVGQTEEDVPLPDWPVRVAHCHNYSTGLEIDCPDGAQVEVVR